MVDARSVSVANLLLLSNVDRFRERSVLHTCPAGRRARLVALSTPTVLDGGGGVLHGSLRSKMQRVASAS
jgi:hypothetical protein